MSVLKRARYERGGELPSDDSGVAIGEGLIGWCSPAPSLLDDYGETC